LIVSVAGFVAFLAWLLVLFKLDPYQSMGIALGFFFVTFFITLACLFTVLGFYFRVWLLKNEIFYKHINTSLRQGFFLSLIASLSLVFQMMKVLSWWSGLLLVLIFVLLELYFSSQEADII